MGGLAAGLAIQRLAAWLLGTRGRRPTLAVATAAITAGLWLLAGALAGSPARAAYAWALTSLAVLVSVTDMECRTIPNAALVAAVALWVPLWLVGQPGPLAGALFGAVFGHAWTALWPGTEPGAYAIIGASAMLAAAMQAPLASLALMVELTGTGGSLLVPLILAVIGAMLVSRALDDRSIYTAPLRHFGEPTVVRHPRDRGTPGPRDRDVTPG